MEKHIISTVLESGGRGITAFVRLYVGLLFGGSAAVGCVFVAADLAGMGNPMPILGAFIVGCIFGGIMLAMPVLVVAGVLFVLLGGLTK